MSTSSAMPEPSVFLSYVHDDDKHLDGMLVKFARAVKERCDYKGVPIDLKIDKDVLRWGDDWSEKLQEQVERTTFLLAMVTNRYLTSKACREEFLRFRTKTKAAKYDGLLTLLIDKPRWNSPDLRDNPTVQLMRDTINQYQWLEPETKLEDLEPGGPQFKKTVNKVADELIRRIDERDEGSAEPPVDTDKEDPHSSTKADEAPGLIELADAIQNNHLPTFQERTSTFEEAMKVFGTAMTKEFALVPHGSLPSATQVKRITKGLEPSRRALDSAISSFSEAWNDLDKDISSLVRVTGETSMELTEEMKDSLGGLAASLDIPGTDDMAAQIKAFATFSRALRPVAETMTKALSVMDAIKRSADAWAEEL